MEPERLKKRSQPSSEGQTKKQRTNPKRNLRPRRRRTDQMSAGVNGVAMDLVLDSLSQVSLEDFATAKSIANPKYRESSSTSRDSFSPLARVTVIPTLPSENNSDSATYNDVTSDTESEFCPDWSNDDESCNDSIDDVANDVMMGSSSEELEFPEITFLPIPASGNDAEEGTSSQAASEGRQSPVTKLKPQAVRRVKSMIFEGGKDDEVDAGQRAKVMMRKQVREVTPSQIAMLPSPLLSAEDAGSLKRSPSQLSAKFSLKRSRSNLTVTDNYIKRHPHIFDSDVIEEESDEDSMSDVSSIKSEVLPKKIHPRSKPEP